jgi:hypothetical protein
VGAGAALIMARLIPLDAAGEQATRLAAPRSKRERILKLADLVQGKRMYTIKDSGRLCETVGC